METSKSDSLTLREKIEKTVPSRKENPIIRFRGTIQYICPNVNRCSCLVAKWVVERLLCQDPCSNPVPAKCHELGTVLGVLATKRVRRSQVGKSGRLTSNCDTAHRCRTQGVWNAQQAKVVARGVND